MYGSEKVNGSSCGGYSLRENIIAIVLVCLLLFSIDLSREKFVPNFRLIIGCPREEKLHQLF